MQFARLPEKFKNIRDMSNTITLSYLHIELQITQSRSLDKFSFIVEITSASGILPNLSKTSGVQLPF